ncbi:MAG: alpha/beta hydrolase domain-containing protein [Vicinamibacterales bacterium]
MTILTIGLLIAAFSAPPAAQLPLTDATETAVPGGVQLKGKVAIHVDGQPVGKRFVIRVPSTWNGALVVGAHGGSGGDAVDRSGRVYATSETALDDVIGAYAFEHGFAYASIDRDGIGGTRAGSALTIEFATWARGEVGRLGKSTPRRMYAVGLSAGGGITRMIVESKPTPFDGAVIIAGAGADLVTRLDRQARMAALWPLIDPRAHSGLADNEPKIVSYAEAIGTPVAARRLWPYTGAGAIAAASRPAGTVENSTAQPSIPTIEVVGTWDDLVIREVRAYRDRVEPKERHRLYQVEGVWHMSSDDDGVSGFQYAAESRMKLEKDVADAMGEGPSYIPTVREAFDYLVRWVEKGTAPPVSQTVKPATKLR